MSRCLVGLEDETQAPISRHSSLTCDSGKGPYLILRLLFLELELDYDVFCSAETRPRLATSAGSRMVKDHGNVDVVMAGMVRFRR